MRLGWYFAEIIPLAVRLMNQPAWDRTRPGRTPLGGNPPIQERLAEWFKHLPGGGQLSAAPPEVAAGLIVPSARDWALGLAMSGETPFTREGE